jgi:hypothetical protein
VHKHPQQPMRRRSGTEGRARLEHLLSARDQWWYQLLERSSLRLGLDARKDGDRRLKRVGTDTL